MGDAPDVGLGPHLLAIETAVRALIEQASLTDRTLRTRIKEAADACLASSTRGLWASHCTGQEGWIAHNARFTRLANIMSIDFSPSATIGQSSGISPSEIVDDCRMLVGNEIRHLDAEPATEHFPILAIRRKTLQVFLCPHKSDDVSLTLHIDNLGSISDTLR